MRTVILLCNEYWPFHLRFELVPCDFASELSVRSFPAEQLIIRISSHYVWKSEPSNKFIIFTVPGALLWLDAIDCTATQSICRGLHCSKSASALGDRINAGRLTSSSSPDKNAGRCARTQSGRRGPFAHQTNPELLLLISHQPRPVEWWGGCEPEKWSFRIFSSTALT